MRQPFLVVVIITLFITGLAAFISRVLMVKASTSIKFVFLFLVLACSMPRVVLAIENSNNQLFNMPLEALLNISVVSKSSESIVRSPGIVSAYSTRDLQSMGLHTLKDFLLFVPGIEINEQVNGDGVAQIRGLPANSNQKILFVIDGVPYWMPESGDFPFNGVPIAAIERIEVIRGPGGVVYGTNASAGVINIITRDESGVSVEAFATYEDLYNTSIFFGDRKGDLWANVSAEVQRDNGYSYRAENAFDIDPCFCNPETANGNLRSREEHESLLIHTGWKDLSATLQTFSSLSLGDVNSSFFSSSLYEAKGTLLGLRYKSYYDWGKVELYSDWNRYYRDIDIDDLLSFFAIEGDGEISFDHSGSSNTRFRNGLSVQLKQSDNISWLFGLEYEERETGNKKFRDDADGADITLVTLPPFNFGFQLQPDGSVLLVEASRTYEKSAYLQTDISLDDWRAVLGFRHIDNTNSGSDFSPRASLIYSLDEVSSLKLLFSESFNSPTFSQIAATDSFGVPQNLDISAETIKTWDLAYTRSNKNLHQVMSFFHIEAEDLILSLDNSDKVIERNGAEYEWQYRSGAYKFMGGLSFIYEGDGKGDDENANFASKWLSKLGAVYKKERHSFGASLRMAGKRGEAGAYQLLNLNYKLSYSRDLEFFGSILNALDDELIQPDSRTLNALLIEASAGRGILLGFNFRMGQ